MDGNIEVKLTLSPLGPGEPWAPWTEDREDAGLLTATVALLSLYSRFTVGLLSVYCWFTVGLLWSKDNRLNYQVLDGSDYLLGLKSRAVLSRFCGYVGGTAEASGRLNS